MMRFLLKERIAEKEFHEKRRITVEEVARETNISRHTLSRIMNTFGYVAKTDAIDKLCSYFGVQAGKIMEHIEDTEN